MMFDTHCACPSRPVRRGAAYFPHPAESMTDAVSLTAVQVEHQEVRMMKRGRTLSAALLMSVLLAALPGCQKQEGPAERAGKEVDKAAEKVGDKIEKAGESIQDAAKGDKK